MRAVKEVQAQVSRVERVQRESGRLKMDGVWEMSWLQVGTRKRSPEKEAGRPAEAGVESSSRPKTSFSFISTKGTLISFVNFKQDTNFQTIC